MYSYNSFSSVNVNILLLPPLFSLSKCLSLSLQYKLYLCTNVSYLIPYFIDVTCIKLLLFSFISSISLNIFSQVQLAFRYVLYGLRFSVYFLFLLFFIIFGKISIIV